MKVFGPDFLPTLRPIVLCGKSAMTCRPFLLLAVACSLLFQGCETTQSDTSARRAMLMESVRAETPGDYYIGRRFYKKVYKMWGWVRRPGQPWSEAQLVMLNEQRMLAPDRAQNNLGSDNDFEYRLNGYFSGEKVYEPASNTFYPEFVLTGAEIRSTAPLLIYETARQKDPEIRILKKPI